MRAASRTNRVQWRFSGPMSRFSTPGSLPTRLTWTRYQRFDLTHAAFHAILACHGATQVNCLLPRRVQLRERDHFLKRGHTSRPEELV